MEFNIEGTVVDTDKAVNKWDERTGSQLPTMKRGPLGEQRTLYQSAVGGRYYVVHTSEGQAPKAEFVSKDAAIRFIVANGYELPGGWRPPASDPTGSD